MSLFGFMPFINHIHNIQAIFDDGSNNIPAKLSQVPRSEKKTYFQPGHVSKYTRFTGY